MSTTEGCTFVLLTCFKSMLCLHFSIRTGYHIEKPLCHMVLQIIAFIGASGILTAVLHTISPITVAGMYPACMKA